MSSASPGHANRRRLRQALGEVMIGPETMPATHQQLAAWLPGDLAAWLHCFGPAKDAFQLQNTLHDRHATGPCAQIQGRPSHSRGGPRGTIPPPIIMPPHWLGTSRRMAGLWAGLGSGLGWAVSDHGKYRKTTNSKHLTP